MHYKTTHPAAYFPSLGIYMCLHAYIHIFPIIFFCFDLSISYTLHANFPEFYLSHYVHDGYKYLYTIFIFYMNVMLFILCTSCYSHLNDTTRKYLFIMVHLNLSILKIFVMNILESIILFFSVHRMVQTMVVRLKCRLIWKWYALLYVILKNIEKQKMNVHVSMYVLSKYAFWIAKPTKVREIYNYSTMKNPEQLLF